MLKRRIITAIAGIVLALALGYGLLRLFTIRWERGDVYPAYSTLRADPLGMRALFESIEALPTIEVRRNYRPLEQLRPEAPVTLIYAGVPRRAKWGKEELQHFERLVASGSRAIFAFEAAGLEQERPVKKEETERPKETGADAKPSPEEKKGDKKGEESKEKEESTTPMPGPATVDFAEVAERWGLRFDIAKAKRRGSFHGVASATDEASELEQELGWHSALRFADLQPPWRVLYRAAGEPVVIERRWGDGTIVLVADSFFLSNEALMNERNARLLAWLLGSSRTIVFDEEHLGVAEDVGLFTLARKYRLQGALAALALVGLLWVWRQSVRLVPSRSTARREEYVAGLDSHAGFVSLLRRTVPPAKALDVCIEEWRKTFTHDKTALATMEQALVDSTPADSRKADPTAVYHTLTRALKEHKSRRRE